MFTAKIKKVITLVIGLGIITVIFGTVYASVQQSYRQSANDPQIQMAEDAGLALSQGNQYGVASTTINVAQSLAPFMNIYDTNGAIVSAQGQLNGMPAVPPLGVFNYTRPKNAHFSGEDRFTWQPQRGVRIATVLVNYQLPMGGGGYVLVGRNLREVEAHVEQLGEMVFVGWIVSVVGVCILVLI